jgi:hypothetical protein
MSIRWIEFDLNLREDLIYILIQKSISPPKHDWMAIYFFELKYISRFRPKDGDILF